KSGSHAPGSAAPDPSPLIVLAAPPRRSLPSAPHRFFVSSSSWSAPFIKTERHPHHLSRRSRIRGPLHTDAKAIPQELNVIVPDLPSVPVQPLLLKESSEFGMFEHNARYPWVLPLYRYETQDQLIAALGEKVIEPAERKALELR